MDVTMMCMGEIETLPSYVVTDLIKLFA